MIDRSTIPEKSDLSAQMVYLIGYRCTGKTTIGKLLAHLLGGDFIDTDQMVERNAGLCISSLVEAHGWQYFRELEKKALRSIDPVNHRVVATGGGIILDDSNIRWMRNTGRVVWLEASVDCIVSRMESDQQSSKMRPSLTGQHILDEVQKVLQDRLTRYETAAHFSIDTTTIDPNEAALEIKRRIIYGRQHLR